MKTDWPKKPYCWTENNTLYISIPFTWNLPQVFSKVTKPSLFWDKVIVGGPAVELMPNFFSELPWVETQHERPGILQQINPLATRTTSGCPNKCKFCGIGCGLIEPGGFKELQDWPDLPILCDNNLLAASSTHFDKVIDRLKSHGWADFNQGLDARLLTPYHASRIKEIKNPLVRLALDHTSHQDSWELAFNNLRSAGITKRNIRSYALIAFNSDPSEAWARCLWLESHGIKALPMWYHPLSQLLPNTVTPKQLSLGWNKTERTRIMGYFYKHRGIPLS